MKTEKVFLRAPNNYDTMEASDEAGLACLDDSLTQQHQAEEADINYIVQRFGVNAVLQHQGQLPTYGDFTGVTSYQEAMDLIIQANSAFADLPAETRAYFHNDPATFLNYMQNEPDGDVIAELGLGAYTQSPPPKSSEKDAGGDSKPPSPKTDEK